MVIFSGNIDSDSLETIKKIIAKEAVFLPPSDFEKRFDGSKYPHLILSAKGYRMQRYNQNMWKKYIGKGLASEIDKKKRRVALKNINNPSETIYVTDNANNRIRTTFKAAGFVFADKKYEICHIGKNKAHSVDTFGAIPNLVMLPRWIASATDHLQEIEDFLLEKSYSLYFEIMKNNNKEKEAEKLFSSLCGDESTRFEKIKQLKQVNKYIWEKTKK